MCGLLPCEFWRFVVVHPHEALSVAFGAGVGVGIGSVALAQWLTGYLARVRGNAR